MVAKRSTFATLGLFVGLAALGCSKKNGAASTAPRASMAAAPHDVPQEPLRQDASTPSPGATGSGPSSSTPSSEDWTPVVDGEPCGLFAAKADRVSSAKRGWISCGTGCRVAPVSPFGDGRPSLRSASAASLNGDIFVRVVLGYPSKRVVHLSRLSDDTAVTVVEQRANLGGCLVVGGAAGAPFLFPFIGLDFGILVGRATPEVGVLAWPKERLSPPSTPTTVFAFDAGWGMTFADGTTKIAQTLDSEPLTIDANVAPSYHSAGGGHAAVWSAADAVLGREVVRGTVDGSTSWTWVKTGENVHVPSVGDGQVVWIGVSGSNVAEGSYDAAAFYRGPVPAPGRVTTPAATVQIPATTGLLGLQAGGDFAAAIGCSSTEDAQVCSLFVANFASSQLVAIPPRAGSGWTDVLAVGQSEILVGEIDQPSADLGAGQQIQRLVRIELGHLDAFSASSK